MGALAEILPVTIRPNTPRVGQDRWVTHLSDEEHAITSVLNDAELNQQLWPALPVLHRVQHGVQMKEAAQTLLLARQDDMEIPLVAIAEVGADMSAIWAVMKLGAGATVWVIESIRHFGFK